MSLSLSFVSSRYNTQTGPSCRPVSGTLTAEQEHIIGTFLLASLSERFEGERWYLSANRQAELIARAHRLPFLAVVGVVAALSPNNRWERNVTDADNLCRAFVVGGRKTALATKVSTYGANREKAIRILEAAKPPCIVGHPDAGMFSNPSYQPMLDILKGPKVTAFAQCILAARWDQCSAEEWQSVEDAVVIDGHAYSIWFGERIRLADVPNITPKIRAQIVSDYVEASHHLRRLGLNYSPAQVQAITWVAHRRIHGVDTPGASPARPGKNPHDGSES